MGEIRFVGTGETRGYPYLVCKKTRGSCINLAKFYFKEMVPKFEYDKLMEKHSRDILIVQEEYE